MKMLVAAAAVLVSAWFVTSDVSAQKKGGGCPANYAQTCQSACVARGGQTRGCPAYCAKRVRENCKN